MSGQAITQVPAIDPALVRRLCGVTAAFDVVHDQLDDSVWVRTAKPARAVAALNVLNAHGIAGHDLENGGLHVTGWDLRLLHWRLGALLAGVDDLQSEWIGTAELACYHYDRRISVGVEPDWAEAASRCRRRDPKLPTAPATSPPKRRHRCAA